MKKSSLLLLALLAFAVALHAQQHPNVQQGFKANNAFSSFGPDSVNEFNGNLVITIPIGQSYPLSENFSYAITLTYNSNVWDFVTRDYTYTQALPCVRCNAGFGWLVSLGRIVKPGDVLNNTNGWHLIDPSGAWHEFKYGTLHGEAASGSLWYTRDSTYMRMDASSVTNDVEMPDGTIEHYDENARLSEIRDRSGNWVRIAYDNTDITMATLWTITDSAGRTHYVHFELEPWETSGWKYMVSEIDLAGPRNSRAKYPFAYQATGGYVARHRDDNDPLTSANIQVPYLAQVSLPESSAGSYRFSYLGSNGGNLVCTPDVAACTAETPYCTTEGQTGCRLNAPYHDPEGSIRTMTLPTGGSLEYTYEMYTFGGDEPGNITHPDGVGWRIARDAAGQEIGRWRYSQALTGHASGGLFIPTQSLTTVTDPQGNEQLYYFCAKQGDYGMPYTPDIPDGEGRYLSTEAKTCDTCPPKRQTFVRYESDSATYNHSLADEKTIYKDDPANCTTNCRYSSVSQSRNDGFGHYRQTTTGGNFAGNNIVTKVTDYNPGSPDYAWNQVFTKPADSTPWIVGTFDRTTVSDGTHTLRRDFCFDANGLLSRVRNVKDTSLNPGTSANDTLVLTLRDALGNPATIQFFGGDNTPMWSGDACTGSSLGESQEYETWQYGVLKRVELVDRFTQSATGVYPVDRDIDPSTGLVLVSRDVAGVKTEFGYDALGRVTFIHPRDDGWTKITYTAASGTTLARVTTATYANGATSGTVLSQSWKEYDPFGRLLRESWPVPNNSWWTTRTYAMNASGWVTSVTEANPGASGSSLTTYGNFDMFGRPGTVTPPDGAAHNVSFTYAGISSVVATRTIATTRSSVGTILEYPAATTTWFDRFGRIAQVTEPSGTAGSNVTTTYGYDVGGHLASVCINSGGCQTRTFYYDGRGDLINETEPELGPSGFGMTAFLSYDARGNPSRSITGSSGGPFDLWTSYDGLGRVSQIRETRYTKFDSNGNVVTCTISPYTGCAQRVLEEFRYRDTNDFNDPTNARKGKLWQSVRHNYLDAWQLDDPVTQTFEYRGDQGRPSYRKTETPYESFSQSFAWNDLGQPVSVDYPRCLHAGCSGRDAARSVPLTYESGYLKSVGGWASSITYHWNGLPYYVTHQNGVQ
ncbi:MAG: hypothetical protein WBX15_20060, partial [Thermoanaerobaculia bacterium]